MNPHALEILLIEDNSADVFLINRALEEAGLMFRLRTFHNGEDALRFIETMKRGCFPDIFVLDWNLPRVHGRELLRAIADVESLTHTPRIVLTSSESPMDRTAVEELGGIFVSKPRTLDQFLQIGQRVKTLLNGKAAPQPSRG